MAKRKPEIRDDFVKKKKVGPDKFKEVEYDSRTKLMLFLEKIRIIAYFVMNIIFDLLKMYEVRRPLYQKIAKFLKVIIEALAKILLRR